MPDPEEYAAALTESFVLMQDDVLALFVGAPEKMSPEFDALAAASIKLAVDDPEHVSTATFGLLRDPGTEQFQAEQLSGKAGEKHSLWGLENFLWAAFKEGLDAYPFLLKEETRRNQPLGKVKSELLNTIMTEGTAQQLMWYHVYDNRQNTDCEALILQIGGIIYEAEQRGKTEVSIPFFPTEDWSCLHLAFLQSYFYDGLKVEYLKHDSTSLSTAFQWLSRQKDRLIDDELRPKVYSEIVQKFHLDHFDTELYRQNIIQIYRRTVSANDFNGHKLFVILRTSHIEAVRDIYKTLNDRFTAKGWKMVSTKEVLCKAKPSHSLCLPLADKKSREEEEI